MTMKIGIDARFYGTIGKGLGRYVSELITHLEQLDDRNEYVIFLRRENFDDYQPTTPNFRKELAEYRCYSLNEQILFPLFLRRFHLDLMHFPHFNVPILYRRPFITTVHDLILLRFPTVRSTTLNPLIYRLKFLAYRLVIANALRRAKTILTVSRTTKKEIEQLFPRTKNKSIIVTDCACSENFGNNENKNESTERTSAPKKPYTLYVGSAYPHKNLERLVKGFDQFRRQGHENYSLVLVGANDYFYERLQKEMTREQLGLGVTFFGRASDEELADLYRNASFYVFPSLCEGFGIPPLEAMSYGLPVVSSNQSCLPETLGQAALYFDPEDIESMVTAMSRLADDEGLRTKLIEAGRIQCTCYSWRDTAARTLAIYEQSLQKNDERHQQTT
ncbi:hypothetical protein A2480_02270 [Candidatus Uhrbacteria bacterium RIFOXYC2_FULL_47_19]|uniref:Glycosyl transferase family 1 n=1 Tax=Candidatus Uhrbacteria bacterium RIFOXYC2_FULL_47_19 TaxID=1802424 RepID=A0A1F7WEX1_9BACT|nr:MAG: hypothetical protein A2480_02270 [Candidatus Uhrbacteria bacterium RIFOXYC2_FULL_47_19]HCC21938.1 hypothetical protein [Candidatus Uhrbacteria bacterium]